MNLGSVSNPGLYPGYGLTLRPADDKLQQTQMRTSP
jgi:hypothetical protein